MKEAEASTLTDGKIFFSFSRLKKKRKRKIVSFIWPYWLILEPPCYMSTNSIIWFGQKLDKPAQSSTSFADESKKFDSSAFVLVFFSQLDSTMLDLHRTNHRGKEQNELFRPNSLVSGNNLKNMPSTAREWVGGIVWAKVRKSTQHSKYKIRSSGYYLVYTEECARCVL